MRVWTIHKCETHNLKIILGETMILISLKRVDNPVHSPIKLDLIKTYLKIDNDIEDQLLLTLIAAAINQCEECTGLALSKTQWDVTYKVFHDVNEIILPRKPVASILSVYGYYYNGEKSEIDKKLYYLFENRLTFKQSLSFTKLSINFEAGYDNDEVPADIKAILLEHIADMYEKRNLHSNFPIKKYKKGIKL